MAGECPEYRRTIRTGDAPQPNGGGPVDARAGTCSWRKPGKESEMLKKAMAAAAVAASFIGVSAAVAPQALAIGNDTGTTSYSGNGAAQTYGNSATYGNTSPG